MRQWLLVTLLLLSVLLQSYKIAAQSWEYRAVYHYDCNSYMTES